MQAQCVAREPPNSSKETTEKANHDNQPKSAKGWEDQNNKPAPSNSKHENPNRSYKSAAICR
jgi:hypothetical protein